MAQVFTVQQIKIRKESLRNEIKSINELEYFNYHVLLSMALLSGTKTVKHEAYKSGNSDLYKVYLEISSVTGAITIFSSIKGKKEKISVDTLCNDYQLPIVEKLKNIKK